MVELERALGGGSARQSAERLVGGSPEPRAIVARPERRPPPDKPGLDLEIWRAARGPIVGSPAGVYLEGRGIDRRLVAGITG